MNVGILVKHDHPFNSVACRDSIRTIWNTLWSVQSSEYDIGGSEEIVEEHNLILKILE